MQGEPRMTQNEIRIFFRVIRGCIFVSLLAVIVIAAIPYGTVEPWWKAAFVCAVFAICILAIIDMLVSGSSKIVGASILLPMLALSALAFVQTLSFGSQQIAGVTVKSTI